MVTASLALVAAAVTGAGMALVALGTNPPTRAVGLITLLVGVAFLCGLAPAVFHG